MSDVSLGQGWWIASDGKWYAPQPPPPPLTELAESIVAKGRNGAASFDGRSVTINHKGVLAKVAAGSGEKRVPIASIAGVQWKLPGHAVKGVMSLTLDKNIRGVRDETLTLYFGRSQLADFERLRSSIEAVIAKR